MDTTKRLVSAIALATAMVGVPTATAVADEAAPRADAVVTAQDVNPTDDNNDDGGNNYWGLLGLLGLLGLAGLGGRKRGTVHHVDDRGMGR
ncbi:MULTISPECIES: WGxxGxxG family protein [Actinokineospora]|uniref:LPXTG cell wall anchor domain-containing protein n=1 Tax=Actinokineospora fastidiosa TaxID=1816 RepID=A0A918LGR4_9PSEU|nr:MULTISPECIES: WGxxGxxG family protein [Actinokineospora]UVS78743.1 hypothetical protein Actkin_02479 [Actinokineospora sp. UTMC 2448]GGS46692.1 hypothetical protein GCM10010171_47380 [Actinokineospora fastidiosa]